MGKREKAGGGGKAPKSAPNHDLTIGFLKLSIRTFRKSTSGGPLDVQFSRLFDQSKFSSFRVKPRKLATYGGLVV